MGIHLQTKIMTSKETIGIMGVGFVGGALLKYFRQVKRFRPLVYDNYKRLGSLAQINRANVVFICVPTPFVKNKGFDLSAVEAAIKALTSPKIIVIKSSVIPGTTEALQKKYPKHKFIFNPEFLREVSAYRDMAHPDRQILGVTAKSRASAKKIMRLLPKSPFGSVMKSEEAEMVKYMANSFLALKVVYANEFYEMCKKLGLDYKAVKQAVVKDARIGDSHFDVEHQGYQGYGGSCFPKDVNAIIEFAESKHLNPALLKSMRDINRKLLKKSGLDEDFFLNNKHKKKA